MGGGVVLANAEMSGHNEPIKGVMLKVLLIFIRRVLLDFLLLLLAI